MTSHESLLSANAPSHHVGVEIEDDSSGVPHITIERPDSVLSGYSSEPLDSQLWDQLSLYSDTSSTYPARRRPSFSSSPPSSPPLMSVAESPPDYITTVAQPTVPIKYTFATTSYSTMTVVAHLDNDDTRDKYHISISMNCFMPLNHVTTIRRGGTGYGELVAQFEMGISDDPSTILIGNKEYLLKNLLNKRIGSRHAGLWFWNPRRSTKQLLWDCRKTPFVCKPFPSANPKDDANTLATFIPARHGVPGLVIALSQPQVPELTVTPLGQSYFDDLLISLLVIERRRLTPGKATVLKQLFN
ncbi:hypothetical protein BDN70DRAFT_884488 [Pholiota conissans]|uniref:Uncharacterized protein n=1 Tax=Pholiota conissans TaxID=109636 RepID=A0A9P5YSR3_9AGAR|nr:hypothetical protein BDN70DRAFT_884488 [Pholiota conissans]